MQSNSKKSVLLRLMPYFKPHIGKLVTTVISMLIVTMVHLARPMILRQIIDKAIPAADIQLSLQLAGIFMLCLIVGALAMYVRVLIMARMGAEIVADMKRKIFSHILSQGMRFFDHNQSGKLITRTESDANQLKSMFTQSTAQLIASIMLIIGTVLVLVKEDFTIGAIAVLFMAVVVVIMYFYLSFIRGVYTKAREKNSELTGRLTEYIQGVSLIKVHGREEDISKNLHRYNKQKADLECKASFIEFALFSSSFRFVTEIGAIVVLFAYCSMQVFEGEMTVGTMIMYIELLRQFFRPLAHLVEVLAQLQSALAAGIRVFDIFDTPTDVLDNGKSCGEIKLKESIDFKNVSFAYAKETVLDKVSFSVKKGSQIAIVGASGSGKTTCVNLLLRFYDAQDGEICIDNINIKDISLEDWRRNISLVLQEIYLFPGTVMENLKAFHTDIDDQVVINAAKELGAHSFIMRLPDGYNTVLAERAANLSYGERQLLSYTRALVKDPDILILDEATSSVDVITERQLQNSMQKLMQNRTAIVIAHRLSTIRNADDILVFDKGSLIQSGTHDQLMNQEGIYHQLVKIQAGQTVSIENADDVVFTGAVA